MAGGTWEERQDSIGQGLREDQAVGTEQKNEIYVLGLEHCFGEWSIFGVYTSKLKLIEGYRRIMDGNVRCHPFSDSPRKPVIYRFPADEFVGETPEWNDGKLYTDDLEYEISIGELEGSLSLEAET